MEQCPSCGLPLTVKNLAFEEENERHDIPHVLCGGLVNEEIVLRVLLDLTDAQLADLLEKS